MDERESKLLKTQKRYLSLIYQFHQYQINGEDPPDDLIEAITDTEQTVKIIERAHRS